MYIKYKNTHKCIYKAADNECPVCLENLKVSVKGIIPIGDCGHYIHQDCF